MYELDFAISKNNPQSSPRLYAQLTAKEKHAYSIYDPRNKSQYMMIEQKVPYLELWNFLTRSGMGKLKT
ncbi:MAG: hypothetical protein Q7S48_04015 [bacterium]|nr:hypothetical protein [bacterium]